MFAVCECSKCGALYHGDSNEEHVCPDCVYEKLTVEEDASGYDEDTPSDAVVCPKCWGYGKVSGWEGMAEVAEDCPTCDCNGWIVIPL